MTSTTRTEHPVIGPVSQRRATAPASTSGAGLFTLLWIRVSLIVLLALANVITFSRPSPPSTE